MNRIIFYVKQYSLYIIGILLICLCMSQCAKNRYKGLTIRHAIENKKYTEGLSKIDSLIIKQTEVILLLEKEYDSNDSSILSLKKRLNVQE